MKKVFFYCILLFSLVSCNGYDDSYLLKKIDEIDDRLTKLEILCAQMNTNISSLQTIVAALQSRDYVTSVTPVMQGDKEIGYTITFDKSGSITIYHGRDGESGGEGHTPSIGVGKDSDGIYYWTLDGEWLLGNDGKKIPVSGKDGADGISPKLKIEDGFWWISYDDEVTWTKLGQATGDAGEPGQKGDSMFSDVVVNDEYITFVMSDGKSFTLPRMSNDEFFVNVANIGGTSVDFIGVLSVPLSEDDDCEYGIIYSTSSDMLISSSIRLPIAETDENGRFVQHVSDLKYGTQYYYAYYVEEKGCYSIGEQKSFVTVKSDYVPVNYEKKVVFHKFVATDCGFSPNMTKTLYQVQADWENEIVVISTHGQLGATSQYVIPESRELITIWGIRGYPTGLIDYYVNTSDYSYSGLCTSIEKSLNDNPAKVGISFSSQLGGNTLTVTGEVACEETANYKICALVVEDALRYDEGVSFGEDDGTGKMCIFNDVARDYATFGDKGSSVEGISLGEIEAGTKYPFECTVEWNPEWKAENCSVIVYVMKEGKAGKYPITNCNYAKVSQSVEAKVIE